MTTIKRRGGQAPVVYVSNLGGRAAPVPVPLSQFVQQGGGGSGGGGGGGTVNSGTSGQVAYYASTGAAVSGEGIGTLLDSGLSFSTTGYLKRTGSHAYTIEASIDLTADVGSTVLPVANGGTGIASGTSGGVPYYSGSGVIASSGALTDKYFVIGGGAGAAPFSATYIFQDGNGSIQWNKNAASPPSLSTPGFHVTGADSASTGFQLDTFANNGNILFRRADGTNASPTAIQSVEKIGTFSGAGYDGSVYATAQAQFNFIAAENWGTTAHGTQIQFLTTPAGSTTLTRVATMESDGTLYAGSSNSATAKNTGAGTVNVDTGYFVGNTNVTPGHLAQSQSTPSNPTGTTSTAAFVMMGLAGSITPNYTGRVLLTICGDCFNTVLTDGGSIEIKTGTSTAPANAAAVTGTTRGAAINFTSPTASAACPFSITAIVTGLTAGTTYWIDLAVKALVGGTATVEQITITAMEF